MIGKWSRFGLVFVALGGCGYQKDRVDLIIINGTVIDGAGAPAIQADVAIDGGQIVRVGRLGDLDAGEVLDAAGLIVAPGFIDVHTHADELTEMPLAENYVRMGVTTVVGGNCGGSALDVAAALDAIEKAGASVNYATFIGHNTVRREVMGREKRSPTPEELEQMKALVACAIDDGAVGLSTGLQYVPGTYSETDEIIELAKVAGVRGSIYASHMRNEGTEIEAAVKETLDIGEASRCRVQISHLKIDSKSHWGSSEKVLQMIDDARTRGLDVKADQYAYTAAASGIGIRFPSWALEGGQEKINERLDDEATWKQIKSEMKALLDERGFEDLSFGVVASYRDDPSLNGLSVQEIALEQKGTDSADAQLEVAREMLRAGGASMVYHFMSEEDVERIMRHPHVAVASDGELIEWGQGAPHPRSYGNNARVLGYYVREKNLIAVEEAVLKMSSLMAEHFRFANRGMIWEGYAADVVLFDPATVRDTATFEDPHAYAEGIPHVLVNGEFVVRDGRLTQARPGQVLRGSGVKKNDKLG